MDVASGSMEAPALSASPASLAPARAPLKLKTIRISLIPKSVTSEELQTWLKTLAGPENTPAVVQLSIAPNSPSFCQATATLTVLPSKFKNIEEGTLRVEGPQGLRGPKVEVDVHFNGMTVLCDSLLNGTEPAIAE